MIFIRMQAANDSADLNDLRAFTTPEMFAAIKLDLQERGAKAQRTDVVRVDAEVLDVASEAERQIVSVRFHGLIREEDERRRRAVRRGLAPRQAGRRQPRMGDRRHPADGAGPAPDRPVAAPRAGADAMTMRAPPSRRRPFSCRCRSCHRLARSPRPARRCRCRRRAHRCHRRRRRRAGEVVAPNANLVVQGIPPVPASIASAVARYTDFRGHRFVDWHPTRREMLVSHRRAGVDTTQIFRIAGPLAEPEPLTDGERPGPQGELRADRRQLHRLRARQRRRRGGAALSPRPGDAADDAPHRARSSATTCKAGCIARAGCSTSRCRSTGPRAAAAATRSRRRSG